jgi:hypothetical protein
MRLFIIFVACCVGAVANASAADIRSISRLAAGPENVLFVADWKMARVHAITLPKAVQKPPGTTFNILDLEPLLSKQVGGARITVDDMVARPGTAEVYVALSYGAAKTPALIVVTSDHKARRIDLLSMASNHLQSSPHACFRIAVAGRPRRPIPLVSPVMRMVLPVSCIDLFSYARPWPTSFGLLSC